MAIWAAAKPSCRWPAWSERENLGIATAYVPTGWERVVGEDTPSEAVISLGRSLKADPSRVRDLGSPILLGICDGKTETLTVLNDQIGVARLSEMAIEGGCVWSNRLGALRSSPAFPRMRTTAAGHCSRQGVGS